MRLRILRAYLDFEKGKQYDITNPNEARYMIAMSIAKEVVTKDGKAETTTVPKKEIKIDNKISDIPEDVTEPNTPIEDFKESEDEDDLNLLGF